MALGYGQVGAPLADHLQQAGHQVTLAANDSDSESVKKALIRNANLKVAPPRDAVREAEVVFLATPFQANEAALKAVADALQGKILIDCTNPVGPNLSHGLHSVCLFHASWTPVPRQPGPSERSDARGGCC